MPARTKGRAKFDFRGRPFVWWVDGDKYLRISSLDKRFIISVPFAYGPGVRPAVEVIGQEFPGLRSGEPRPICLKGPAFTGASLGATVDELLRWAFDPARSASCDVSRRRASSQ